ncbi:MAG: transglutaminase-like domain-containing protein [Methanospirillum sp.]|uniref:hypothetical protein n=1 Tax=Methanospirillum sp. TaxID=45200 RepID=UPI00236C7F95|nr:hypothetical protein [Methanospirillum sp.]MDD1728229.1 transglutaminase-like domain-containing protein [Methanospirillum sp.]
MYLQYAPAYHNFFQDRSPAAKSLPAHAQVLSADFTFTGHVYFEIPLDEINDPFINLTADYQFNTSERRFEINSDSIEPYDATIALYQKYTTSQPNIEITPEINTLARSIVGDEQNPYPRARMIYEYVINTYPYSNVPHSYLAASQIPESTYMLET